MDGHDAVEKILARRPFAAGVRAKLLDFADLQRRECSGKARGRAGGEDQFQRVCQILPPFARGLAAHLDGEAMLAVLDHWRAVEVEEFEIAMEVGRRHEQVERMAGRQQRLFHLGLGHGGEGTLQQFREPEPRERRFEPAAANEMRNLAPHLVARFRSDFGGNLVARSAQQPVGKRLRPELPARPAQFRIGVGQFVDIGDFEP